MTAALEPAALGEFDDDVLELAKLCGRKVLKEVRARNDARAATIETYIKGIQAMVARHALASGASASDLPATWLPPETKVTISSSAPPSSNEAPDVPSASDEHVSALE